MKLVVLWCTHNLSRREQLAKELGFVPWYTPVSVGKRRDFAILFIPQYKYWHEYQRVGLFRVNYT